MEKALLSKINNLQNQIEGGKKIKKYKLKEGLLKN